MDLRVGVGRQIIHYVSYAAMFLALSACIYSPFGYTSIKSIVQNPSQYQGKEVKVRGTVSGVTQIPFVNSRFYTLTEDNYQIVVTTKGALPAQGESVAVAGIVDNVAIIGNESIGQHIRETERWER